MRLVQKRITTLKRELAAVRKKRQVQRKKRMKVPVPNAAIVGYTNAGKSTLFNALTDASVYVEDQLFATLDPTVRRVELPDGRDIVLADTVGFVRDLPHELIAAFRSTLQEAREADLILHLIDASDENRWQRVRQVNSVLKQLDADRVPQIRVYNKIDKLDAAVDDNTAAVMIELVQGEGGQQGAGVLARHVQRGLQRADQRAAPHRILQRIDHLMADRFQFLLLDLKVEAIAPVVHAVVKTDKLFVSADFVFVEKHLSWIGVVVDHAHGSLAVFVSGAGQLDRLGAP